MQIRVLGSAAGGGSPQWNCRCSVCEAVRSGAPGTRPRTQSSIAVRGAEADPWLLVNASPDVHRQLPLLEGPGGASPPSGAARWTPVGGVLLTDAEIDHASGLLLLREATEPLRIWGTAPVRTALERDWPLLSMLERWCGVDWSELRPDADEEAALPDFGLSIETFTTGEDAPRYQPAGSDGPGNSIGVTFTDAAGHRTTFCPTLETWTDALAQRFASSDLVLVDGTFWRDDELAQHGAPNPRTARQMGHLHVGGPDGSAVRLAQLDARVVYVHVNNSNPMLLDGASERAELDRLGLAIGFDGMEVEL